eukprot:SAG31_NODE_87_length_26728_cov_40.161591_16_plen_61_part_00
MEGEENDKLARALSEEEQSALERQAMSDMETLSTEEMKKLIEMRTYMVTGVSVSTCAHGD